jgi:magnesium transporter
MWKQLAVGTLIGAVFGLVAGLIAYAWHGTAAFGVVVGLSLAVTIVVAALLGAVLPVVLHRLGLQPALAGAPLVDALNSVLSVTLYVLLATFLLRNLR